MEDYSMMAGGPVGLLPQEEEPKGLLDRIASGINRAYSDPGTRRGLTSMGMALMDAAGPRPLGERMNTGQMLARGFAGYQQGKDAYAQEQARTQDAMLKRAALMQKMQQAQGEAGKTHDTIKVDDLGQVWGRNLQTGVFEKVPMGSNDYQRFKTSTYVDPTTGGVSTVLVNPRDVVGGGQQATRGSQPEGQPGDQGVYRIGGDKSSDKQDQAASFATRMDNANAELQSLRDRGYVSPGITDKLADMLPSAVQGYVQSPEYRQYRTAADDWIMSTLRHQSGAAISADETDQYFDMYFPQPGESQEVIDQKAQARKIEEQNMRDQAGPALQRRGSTPGEVVPAPRNNAPQASIQYLMQNPTPEVKKQFREKYGYLPEGI